MSENEMLFRCPVCGAWSSEETLIARTDCDFVETEYGEGLKWVETHKCAECGNLWQFHNSNI